MLRFFASFGMFLSCCLSFAYGQEPPSYERYVDNYFGNFHRGLELLPDGSTLLSGVYDNGSYRYPLLTRLDSNANLLWQQSYSKATATWHPRFVGVRDDSELLFVGENGYDCDVESLAGFRLLRVDGQTGALLDTIRNFQPAEYYAPGTPVDSLVRELRRPLAMVYDAQRERLLLAKGKLFFTWESAVPWPDSVQLLSLHWPAGYTSQVALLHPDTLVLSNGRALCRASITAAVPDTLTVLPAEIDHFTLVEKTAYVLAGGELYRCATNGAAPELLGSTDATRLTSSSGALVLYQEFPDDLSWQTFDVSQSTFGPLRQPPPEVLFMSVSDGRYTLIGEQDPQPLDNLGGFRFLQQGPATDTILLPSRQDISLLAIEADTLFFRGWQVHHPPLGAFDSLRRFSASITMNIGNFGLDTLRSFVFSTDTSSGFCGGFFPETDTLEVNIPPGTNQSVQFTYERLLPNYPNLSPPSRFRIFVALPNGDLDANPVDNYRMVALIASLPEAPAVPRIDIAPNPTMDRWQLSWEAAAFAEYRLTDAYGRVVRRGLLPSAANEFTLPAADLPAGVYLLQLSDRSGRVLTRKLVKQ